jgi:hypothetical protein
MLLTFLLLSTLVVDFFFFVVRFFAMLYYMMRIKENDTVPLAIPQFLCDENAVGEHLNEHPVLQLLNQYSFLTVVGRAGQGKTSLAVAFLTQKEPQIYRKTHHFMYIFMPSNSIASMKKNPFKKLPEDRFYSELNDATIEDVFHKIDANSKDGKKSILFIDDMTASLKSSVAVQDTLKRLVYNRRHLKLNIIITAQSYVNIPLDIRKNIVNLVLYKPSKKEYELIMSELLEMKKDEALVLMKTIYDKPREFMFLNVEHQRIFRCWDEILFEKGGSEDQIESKNQLELK